VVAMGEVLLRLGRRVGGAALALALGSGFVVLAGGPIAWPFDVALNLGEGVHEPGLAVPADGRTRVVVLQHGLFRTAASLGRLERTLQAAGYEVLNPGYASTCAPIASHAAALAAAIAARGAAGRVDEWAFVAHSMGGLVVQEYLRRPDAVVPCACVYLGTPHRGAVLADLRKHWFLFEWAMGTTAACELSPGDVLHQRPIPYGDRSGTVVGDRGDGNASIPGPDDGTVGVAEATFAGARASVTVPCGHTAITTARPVLRHVLHFLRHGGFAPGVQAR